MFFLGVGPKGSPSVLREAGAVLCALKCIFILIDDILHMAHQNYS